MKHRTLFFTTVAVIYVLLGISAAGQSSRFGASRHACQMGAGGPEMMGPGMMGGGKMGGGMMGGDMGTIHQLLANHDKVRRTVKLLPNGIETTTVSSDKAVASLIRKHVPAMYARLSNHQPIHQMDPLFAAVFANADKIHAVVTPLPNGVRVVETSSDPYTVKLIKAHAKAVDDFVAEGMPAMMKRHPVPAK